MKQLKWGLFGLVALVVLAFIFNQSLINHFLPKVYYTTPKTNTVYTTSVMATARLVPRQEREITLEKDAVIEEFFVQAGEYVLAGMPMFRVNKGYGAVSGDLEALQNKEFLAGIEGQVETLVAQEKALAVEKKAAQAQLALAQKDLERVKALFQAQAATGVEVEAAQNAVAARLVAIERMASQATTLKLSRDQLVQSKARKLESLSVIEKDRLARARVKNHMVPDATGVVSAPFDGIVIDMARDPGAVAAERAIGKMGIGRDYKELDLELYVDENQMSRFILNKTYTFTSDTIGTSMGMADGMKVVVLKKGVISENGRVKMTCRVENGSGQPILYQQWQGMVSQESEQVAMTLPKHCVLTSDGNYKPDTAGTTFVVRVKEGVLGKEYVVEAIEVRILGVGDGVVSIKPFDETANSGTLPWVISNFGLNVKAGMRVLAISE